jgi:4-aminobutyrate aminotransferase-like enzyme
VSRIPGPRTAALASRLRARESRNVTFLGDDFPVFWESAAGAVVTDVDGNRYVDCTAAFGVANVGHCNPRVVDAVARQARLLLHGMGDVHPTELRVRLLDRLAEILPPQLARAFLASTGSEAIEAALKTAMLVTGKHCFAAYRGGYHGLSLGALAVTGIERFRAPFAAALAAEPLLLEYPHAGTALHDAEHAARLALANRDDIAALVVEPVLGRGGAVVPPDGYLRALRDICDERGMLLIVDEIFTGFGRTGSWFAIERDGIVPDVICIGKAMGSGVPISAAIGTSAVMDAWPPSTGEALHTSTYLGNPLGCAAALATIDEIERLELPARAERLGAQLLERLAPLLAVEGVREIRGRGLLAGVRLESAGRAAAVVRAALRAGVIFLQAGIEGDVIGIAPPLTIESAQLASAAGVLEAAVRQTA